MSTLLCYFNCADSTHADVLDKNDKNIAVRNELILIIEKETILHSGCQSMLYSLYFFAKTRTVISSDILLKSTQKIFNLLQFLPIFFNCYDNYTILCCPSLFAYCFVTVPVAQIPVSPANYILFSMLSLTGTKTIKRTNYLYTACNLTNNYYVACL